MDQKETVDKKESNQLCTEVLVSTEALSILDRYCEANPEQVDKIRLESRKAVEILADFTLDWAYDSDRQYFYDAALLMPMLDTDHNQNLEHKASGLLNDFIQNTDEGADAAHKFYTIAVLADVQHLNTGVDLLRAQNPVVTSELENATEQRRRGQTPSGFHDEFDLADARDVMRKVETVCPEASLLLAASLLYRLNRSDTYTDQEVLRDIVDAETFFAPALKVKYEAFSIALHHSAEVARLKRNGQIAELLTLRITLDATH